MVLQRLSLKTRFAFIGRTAELEWLSRNTRLSPLVAIVGVRGIGKTGLARHWIEKTQLRTRWYSADRMQSLSELLGTTGDPESALEEVSQTWNELDAIVWDDVEQIHPKSRNTLLSFLKAKPGLPLQILISEEELTRDHSIDLSQLKLGPFAKSDIEDLLKHFQVEIDSTQSEALQEIDLKTGGIPLLLKLWLQSPHHNTPHIKSLLGELPALDQEIFSLTTTLARIYGETEILSISQEFQITPAQTKEILDALVRKNLVENIQGLTSGYRTPAYIRNLFLKEIGEITKNQIKKKLLEILSKEASADAFEVFLLAIETSNFNLAEKYFLKFPLNKLETLNSTDLKNLTSYLDTYLKKLSPNTLQMHARCVRLHMRSLFLCGMRAEALKQAESLIQLISKNNSVSDEEQSFILEYVELLNRNSQFSEAKNIGRRFIQKIQDPTRSLLSIELGVAQLSTDLKQAQEILAETLRTAKKALIENPDHREWHLVQAQACFQLGRAFDFSNRDKEAEKLFETAFESFRFVGQTYFATVSLMNRALLLLRLKEWHTLSRTLRETRLEAEKFGYFYILAGLNVIESTQNRLFLKPGLSLHRIETAIKYLGTPSPTQPFVDAYGERARVYLQLGLRTRAKQEFKKIESLISNKDDSILKEQLETLRLEIESINLTFEEWLEKWEHSPYGQEARKLLTTRMKLHEANSNTLELLQSYPLGQLIEKEATLTQYLTQGEKDLAWRTITELEQILEQATDPCAEKLALFLIQANLIESPERKEDLLQQAEVELQRWGCDLEVKAPLQAWLNSIRTGETGRSPDQDLLWKKASSGDRDRWKKWWAPLWTQEILPYRIYTLEGVSNSETTPTPEDIQKGLYISEKLSEAYCNRKNISELSRRHSLRKLLSLFLESYPQSVSKATLAGAVWGEAYNPTIHDPRIYTSIQRLRSLIKLQDCIQSTEQGYRWNPKHVFMFIRQNHPEIRAKEGNPRIQGLILHALESYAQNGQNWVSRSDLVEVAGSSDATVKRELSRLLSESLIQRRGAGRSVEYTKSSF